MFMKCTFQMLRKHLRRYTPRAGSAGGLLVLGEGRNDVGVTGGEVEACSIVIMDPKTSARLCT
jgi:hypothetical protein